MTKSKLLYLGAGTALLAMSPAAAGNFQSLDDLDVAVAAHAGAKIGDPGGARTPIDRRLKLKACPDAPSVSGPVLGAAVVRCEPIGWSIRVPLRLDAATSGATNSNNGVPRTMASRQQERDAIVRGQAVRLTVEGRGFTLSRTMIADANGKIGDMISVRADRSSKPVLARVVDIGEVSVSGI